MTPADRSDDEIAVLEALLAVLTDRAPHRGAAMTPRTRSAVALAGVSLATTALAGCSGGAAAGSDGGATNAAASFKDGTYSSLGTYTSPGGASAVQVTVTLKSNTVTAVKVVPKAENPTAKSYEAQFASGVGDKVIGKKLSELNVTKVSGSSLTSQGFDRAIADIEQQAKA